MTNEEKLLKLIKIAVENGYEDDCDYIHYLESDGYIKYLRVLYHDRYFQDYLSINDLVLNFEEDKTSFIQFLYKEMEKRNISYSNTPGCYVDESFRMDWVLLSTSKRLEFLFETFSCLLC